MKTKHIIPRRTYLTTKWNKEFVEAGKARLDGDTHRTKNVFKKITAFIEKFKELVALYNATRVFGRIYKKLHCC